MKAKESTSGKGTIKMEEKNILKYLAARGAKQILEFLYEQDTARCHQMEAFMNTYTLNRRLHELLALGLIKHHFKKEGRRKEWYELTEKGEKVVQCLRNLERI